MKKRGKKVRKVSKAKRKTKKSKRVIIRPKARRLSKKTRKKGRKIRKKRKERQKIKHKAKISGAELIKREKFKYTILYTLFSLVWIIALVFSVFSIFKKDYFSFVILIIIMFLISLIASLLIKKVKRKKLVVALRALNKESRGFETDLDRLFLLLRQFKKLKINEIAFVFNIDAKKVEEWCKILEEHGLAELNYPAFGQTQLKWKEK